MALPLEGLGMAQARYSDEHCLKVLRQVEVDLATGQMSRRRAGRLGLAMLLAPRSTQCRVVCHNQICSDRHQSVASATGKRHAT